jgi:Uma2 family endonuclease
MNVMLPPKMTVDEYLVWGASRPGRFELINGVAHPMSPERVRHLRAKGAAYVALLGAIQNSGLACHALPDGATVRINETTAFEPDVLVYCGPEQDGDSIEIIAPMIVVEVISPGSRKADTGFKIPGYFGVPSIRHYLVLDADTQTVIHHCKPAGRDSIETRIAREGYLVLNPPGLQVDVAQLFAGR